MRGKRKAILCLCIVAMAAALAFMGRSRVNSFFAQKYELQGIDVSHYQGDVDWNALRAQGVDFSFIKATEGSGYTDPCFSRNWKEAQGVLPCVGAYHFFSFDSPAETQAELFIRTVKDLAGKLPPAVDVEYYGAWREHPPDQDKVREELLKLCRLLEEYYGAKPVIYTTYPVYFRYIRGEFDQYPLWIRNVYWPPGAELGARWTFWQYTDRAQLEGYRGAEKYIDRNVFRGGAQELGELLLPSGQEEMDSPRRQGADT